MFVEIDCLEGFVKLTKDCPQHADQKGRYEMEKIYQDGDILVFKAGDHWLSKCIALATNSDVSHAAMIYKGEILVEMELPGIQLTAFEAEPGEGAHLMRLKTPQDPKPLLDAADAYLHAKTRYDLPALVLLAGVLLYCQVRPTLEYVAIADLIMKTATKVLDSLIQKVILEHPDKAMVCSQLVHQIYSDCGRNYRIELENSVFFSPVNNARLIDHLRHSDDLLTAVGENASLTNRLTEDISDEELGRRLCQVLEHQNGNFNKNSLDSDIRPLLSSGKQFLDRLEQFLKKVNPSIPLDSLFVMPADLAYHATNLDRIDCLHIIKHELETPQGI